MSAVLLLLGLLAMLSLILCDLRREYLNLAICAPGLLAIHQARRWQRRAPQVFVFHRGTGQASCDGEAMQQLRVVARCGLLVLDWQQACGSRQCVLLPWQLPGPVHSELRQWPQSASPFHKRRRGGTID